jgi:hypothetical protein
MNAGSARRAGARRALLVALSAAALAASLPLSAEALSIKLPLLGSPSETAKPVELSLPPITLNLPVVTVSTPAIGVTVNAPATTPPVTTPPATTPTVPSLPIEAPASSAPVTSPVAGGSGTGTSSPTSPAATVASTTSSQGSASTAGHSTAVVQGGSSRVRSQHHAARGKRLRSARSVRVVAGKSGTLLGPGEARAPSRTPPQTNRSAHTRRAASSPLSSLGKDIPLPIPVPDWSKPIILALIALAGFFALRSRLAARRAGRLEGQRETLLRDLDVVQAALVPDVPALIGGLSVSVAYRPADGPAAGGDFYDVFLLEPGKVVMILGDVSGHGHEAVSHAALTRYTLRAYMQAGLEPRAALALAGQVMADPTCGHFATVAVGVYREQEGTFTYASAGHPGPIILGRPARPASEACCSPPIGWSVPTGRRQSTVSLPADAVVCFFTDGLPEARASRDLLMGRERVQELFAALGPRPRAGDLLEQVRAVALSTPDDMAACVLHAQACGSAPPIHTEELEVDLRRLRGDAVSRFMDDCLVPSQVAARVLARARTIAGERGTALIRVTLGDHAGSAIVVPVGPQISADLARELQVGPFGARPVPVVSTI